MKLLKFVLILSFIEYFSAQDECTIAFENILMSKCTSLDSCDFSNKICLKTKLCESVTDPTECSNTIHPQIKKYFCGLDSDNRCISIPRECSEYEKTLSIDGKYLLIKNCSDLYAGEGKRCDYKKGRRSKCIAHYNDCKSDLTGTDCTGNIPSDFSQKCIFDTICKKQTRKCIDEDLIYVRHKMTKDICEKLEPSDSTSGKGCFHDGRECREMYEKCSSYKGENPTTDCATIIPLKTDDGKKFTYFYKCSPNGSTCKSEKKTCSDFGGIDSFEFCPLLSPTDNNKVCVYNIFVSPPCEERYKTCAAFFSNESTKTKATCESYTPPNTSKHCVWKGTSDIEGVCEEPKVYLTCEEYDGNDKETCESIGGEKNCILDKDTTCKTKILHCSDTNYINNCARAIAKSDKKECIFYDGQCIENYKTCEDYIGNNKAICEAIIQYNGKKCVFDSTGCKSYNKICSEALSIEECLLIAKTGVAEPERKVCDYISGTDGTGAPTFTCYENYKYCSDYRTDGRSSDEINSAQEKCQRIKPYDSSGNNLDVTSECEYKTENNVGCQRKLSDCYKAKTSTECESISSKLENTNFYCAFLEGKCSKYYKTCELYDEDTYHDFNCNQNIPKDYDNKYCELEGEKCVSKTKGCSTFLKNFVEASICTEISPFCYYSSFSCEKKMISMCSDITILEIPTITEEICNSFELYDSSKICSLSADKTRCEEKEKKVIPVIQETTLALKTQAPNPQESDEIETTTIQKTSSTAAATIQKTSSTTAATIQETSTHTAVTPQEQGSSFSSEKKLKGNQIIMVILFLLILI